MAIPRDAPGRIDLHQHILQPGCIEDAAAQRPIARIIVANLRLAAGRHPDDTRLNELIGAACVKVPEFNGWWAGHQLDDCSHGTQRLHHAVVGDLTVHHEALNFATDPDQTMCLYTAEPGSSSAQTLALLASWSAPAAR